LIKYYFAVFLSAYLLFQLQPIAAKFLLPLFGGSAGVWAVCLVFFQTFLLLGYLYAHFLTRIKSVKNQIACHSFFIFLSILFLPINFDLGSGLDLDTKPEVVIFTLLTMKVALPYTLLASSGPLFQSWFSREFPSKQPYRLYGLSNLGSLLGLLSYPFLVELLLQLSSQSLLWTGLFIFYGITALTFNSSRFYFDKDSTRTITATTNIRPTLGVYLTWFLLALVASIALMAVTNQLTLDVASIPLLWVIPFAAYLITFIVCFEYPKIYKRYLWIPLILCSILASILLLLRGSNSSFLFQAVAYIGLLFSGCMFCHGELYQTKPNSKYLTHFYLTIAFGGACGGVSVALVAPLIFDGYWEMQCLIVFLLILIGLRLSKSFGSLSKVRAMSIQVAWCLMIVFVSFLLLADIQNSNENRVSQQRDFYGEMAVSEHVARSSEDGHVEETIRYLWSGSIIHGSKIFRNGIPVFSPTTYYGHESGVGLSIDWFVENRNENLDVGVVGMGAATISTLCEDCDSITYYEIDPKVLSIEENYFKNNSSLRQKGTKVSILVGDGRLILQDQDLPSLYSVLVVDAFTGDSIPVHLLTIEAFSAYLDSLKYDGVLAVHISNRHLDIAPVLVRLAKEFGYLSYKVEDYNSKESSLFSSDWILITKNKKFSSWLESKIECTSNTVRDLPVWTDQYSNLISILRDRNGSVSSSQDKLSCFR